MHDRHQTAFSHSRDWHSGNQRYTYAIDIYAYAVRFANTELTKLPSTYTCIRQYEMRRRKYLLTHAH